MFVLTITFFVGPFHSEWCIPYSGIFSRENIFTNFAALRLSAKIFSVNFLVIGT